MGYVSMRICLCTHTKISNRIGGGRLVQRLRLIGSRREKAGGSRLRFGFGLTRNGYSCNAARAPQKIARLFDHIRAAAFGSANRFDPVECRSMRSLAVISSVDATD